MPLHSVQKAFDLCPVEHPSFLGGVERVDHRVGLVAVLSEERPRHLLLTAPRDARGAERGVPGDVDVVAAPASGCRAWPRRRRPWLPRFELMLGRSWQRESQPDAYIAKHRSLHLDRRCTIDFSEGLDEIAVAGGDPAAFAPSLQRIEDDKPAVDAAGLEEIFAPDLGIG